MPEIFISYARSSQAEARRIADALGALGYAVWWDQELPAHGAYAEIIEERLRSAKAVVVVWSTEAVKSQWVRAEADAAREAATLVQVSIDGAVPPLPFNQIQCADLRGWTDDGHAGWRKVTSSVGELAGRGAAPAVREAKDQRVSICVLPFANMSGDVEQEYFSDGISEDIITDLSKVSALAVISRNSAFQYKGKHVDLPKVARELKVSHVLEGSVRKAGGKVRITAQLIDGATNDHVWAERYDRDLTDIFVLQDEISEAIVKVLKLKLLPEEKKAIERRGTNSVEAYNLYLMARQYDVAGNKGDRRRTEAINRLCSRAIEIDAGYAAAWALIARAQICERFLDGTGDGGGLAAAEKALALDPGLADAHAVKARVLFECGHAEEAAAEIALALRLDPESWEVNCQAANLCFRQHRIEDAARLWEKATALAETDLGSPTMLITCYMALGNLDAAKRAARITVARVEKVVAQDRSNGGAWAYGANALGVLGEAERAKEWIARALLFDPGNMLMRYNFTCGLAAYLKDTDAALNMLESAAGKMGRGLLNHAKVDPDLDTLRDHPRFKAMIEAAEARLAAKENK